MKLTKYNQLVDGLRVRCKIEGVQVDDAMLSVNSNGQVFVMNNIIGRSFSDDFRYQKKTMFAYKNDNIEDWNTTITNLESVEDEITLPVAIDEPTLPCPNCGSEIRHCAKVIMSDKGFNPETLEFDGVKIKEGDIITIYGGKTKRVRWSGQLAHIRLREIDEEPYRPLSMFNVIAHSPRQAEKSELEEAELKYYDARDAFGPNDYNNLDRYYQARKRLDELENK